MGAAAGTAGAARAAERVAVARVVVAMGAEEREDMVGTVAAGAKEVAKLLVACK